MKYCIEKYPLGSFKKQRTAGRYMDGYLHDNLRLLAKKIVDDMTFLGVGFSSTLEVGTGKSVLFQQIGEAYTELVNQIHGLDLTFTTKNIVFRPKELIDRAFELPKYSCIILDEWEDAHYWSEMGMTLRQFFRKCRQLNLFILIIIPNFFQLPASYAISRSTFAIDIRFGEGFERGFFEFYSFQKKKLLYLMGKRTYNYSCVTSDFNGTFLDGYTVGEKEYREAKYQDMLKYEQEDTKPINISDIKAEIYRTLRKNMPHIKVKEWSVGFGVSERTLNTWGNPKESK